MDREAWCAAVYGVSKSPNLATELNWTQQEIVNKCEKKKKHELLFLLLVYGLSSYVFQGLFFFKLKNNA